MTSNYEPLEPHLVENTHVETTNVDSAQPGPARQSRPALLHRSLTRPAGLVTLTGLAAGAGFAAVTGISSASPSTSTSAASTSASSSTASPSTASTSTTPTSRPTSTSTAPGTPGAGRRHGGPGFGGFGHGGFGGGEGTVTAINGASLTLRTANGTETVKTTSATKYTKERTTVSLASIKVGDVLRVSAPRPSTPAAKPTTLPGTGTVTATAIDVVLPMLSGRVSAVGSGQYTIVGRSGELLTVSVSSSTTYYNGATKTTSAAIKVGTRIVAEGAQNTLTHLSADIVTVLTAPNAGGGWGHGGAGR